MHHFVAFLLYQLWSCLTTFSTIASARIVHRKLRLASEKDVVKGTWIVELDESVTDIAQVALNLTAAYSTAKIRRILGPSIFKGFVVSGTDEMLDAFEESPLVISVSQVRDKIIERADSFREENSKELLRRLRKHERVTQSTHTHQLSPLLSFTVSIVLVQRNRMQKFTETPPTSNIM